MSLVFNTSDPPPPSALPRAESLGEGLGSPGVHPNPDSSLLPIRPQGWGDQIETAWHLCVSSSLPPDVTFPSAFPKTWVSPGGLIGKFGEHTAGLCSPSCLCPASHSQLGCDEGPAEQASVICSLHSDSLFQVPGRRVHLSATSSRPH